MKNELSLDNFISRLAKKIVVLYPNNCADEEDYIQAGYLKLAEISSSDYDKRDLKAYAIVSIARAMRSSALGAMGAASAPERVKKLVHRVKLLLAEGKTEQDVQKELQIDSGTLSCLKSLLRTESWHDLFNEPVECEEPFCAVNDLLSSGNLTPEDKIFLTSQIDDVDNLEMTRKQRWTRTRRIRKKLIRSGYGT